MPSHRLHLLGYVIVSAAFVFFERRLELLPAFGLPAWALAFFVGGVYTLLPDIDSPSSRARRFFEVASLLLVVALLLSYSLVGGVTLMRAAIFLSAIVLILWFVKHRGIVHTPIAALVLSSPLYLVHPLAAGFGFLGYMTHLILDGRLMYH